MFHAQNGALIVEYRATVEESTDALKSRNHLDKARKWGRRLLDAED